MTPWTEQSREERYLFNPAFLGALAREACDGYRRERGPMPIPLAFVVLPVVLHKPTRSALPRIITTSLAAWLQEHGDVLIGFPERAQSLVDHVREGLLFAACHGAITISPDYSALVAGTLHKVTSDPTEFTEDFRDCMKKAFFAGRWLARAGDPGTVMTLWGVRP